MANENTVWSIGGSQRFRIKSDQLCAAGIVAIASPFGSLDRKVFMIGVRCRIGYGSDVRLGTAFEYYRCWLMAGSAASKRQAQIPEFGFVWVDPPARHRQPSFNMGNGRGDLEPDRRTFGRWLAAAVLALAAPAGLALAVPAGPAWAQPPARRAARPSG